MTRDLRTADQLDPSSGDPACPYACTGTIAVEAEGTWGDGRRVRYGICRKCGRSAEVVAGIDQLDMDALLGVPDGVPTEGEPS